MKHVKEIHLFNMEQWHNNVLTVKITLNCIIQALIQTQLCMYNGPNQEDVRCCVDNDRNVQCEGMWQDNAPTYTHLVLYMQDVNNNQKVGFLLKVPFTVSFLKTIHSKI